VDPPGTSAGTSRGRTRPRRRQGGANGSEAQAATTTAQGTRDRETPGRGAGQARVSTADQQMENQLQALRSFAAARGWTPTEYNGISGAKERRPALDALLEAVRKRRVDVVACVKLDQLARSTHHLVTLAKEFQTLGVDLIVLDQALDTTTPSGRLLFHVLAAIAEFERDLIRDRAIAGIRRAKAQGRRLGRPRRYQVDVDRARQLLREGLSLRTVARALGAHPTAVSRALAIAQPLL
jgi:DNA invertase Pin-like site-specific DNA recombinase